MRQNIKLLKKEFENFLISSRKHLKNSREISLLSCLFEFNDIEISKLVDSKLLIGKSFFYWNISDEFEEFLGIDAILNISENGIDRLSQTSKKVNNLENKIFSNWENDSSINIPLFMGGIKFAPNQTSERWKDFNDSDWFIPRFLFLKNSNRSFIIYNFLHNGKEENEHENEFNFHLDFLEKLFTVENINNNISQLVNPFHSNSVDDWKEKVDTALNKISQGDFTKVVLSREVNLELTSRPQFSKLLNELSIKYPKCYTFAFQKNESIFIGTSPEKLAKFSKGWIEVDALAGSAPRGLTLEEDIKYEQFLLNSKKNINEQQSVVNFITNLINNISDEIYFDEKPIIRKLPNIQHLWTLIKAKMNKNYKIFDVLLKLHPTPAICGTPWNVAQKYILEVEEHDRGLYSGNIGWFNYNGSGEFAVGIRSALIKDTQLYAYSGCGIVEGSEPQSEFEESEIKLKPILSLFVDEKIYQS